MSEQTVPRPRARPGTRITELCGTGRLRCADHEVGVEIDGRACSAQRTLRNWMRRRMILESARTVYVG